MNNANTISVWWLKIILAKSSDSVYDPFNETNLSMHCHCHSTDGLYSSIDEQFIPYCTIFYQIDEQTYSIVNNLFPLMNCILPCIIFPCIIYEESYFHSLKMLPISIDKQYIEWTASYRWPKMLVH